MDHQNIYQNLLATLNTEGRTYLTRFITDHDIGTLWNLQLAIAIMVSQYWTPSDLKKANNLLLAKYTKYKLIDQSLADQLMMAGGDEDGQLKIFGLTLPEMPTSSMQSLVDSMWYIFDIHVRRLRLKEKHDALEETYKEKSMVLYDKFKLILPRVGNAYIKVHKLNKSLFPGIIKVNHYYSIGDISERFLTVPDLPKETSSRSQAMTHLTIQEIKGDPQNAHFQMIEPHTYSLRMNRWIRTTLNPAMRSLHGKGVVFNDIYETGLNIFFRWIRMIESSQECQL